MSEVPLHAAHVKVKLRRKVKHGLVERNVVAATAERRKAYRSTSPIRTPPPPRTTIGP